MITKVNGKNIDITKGMQGYLDKKMKYFNKFLSEDTPVQISVSKRGNKFKIEAYFQYRRKDVKAKVEEAEYYAAVDKLVDNLKNTVSDLHKQMTDRNKTSLRDQHRAQIAKELEESEDSED